MKVLLAILIKIAVLCCDDEVIDYHPHLPLSPPLFHPYHSPSHHHVVNAFQGHVSHVKTGTKASHHQPF